MRLLLLILITITLGFSKGNVTTDNWVYDNNLLMNYKVIGKEMIFVSSGGIGKFIDINSPIVGISVDHICDFKKYSDLISKRGYSITIIFTGYENATNSINFRSCKNRKNMQPLYNLLNTQRGQKSQRN